MAIDSSGDFGSVSKIEFINATILEQDIDLENVWWLMEEVYPKEDNYEMHMLFEKANWEKW